MTYTFDPAQSTPAREPTPEEWAVEVAEAQEAFQQLQTAVLIGRAAMWAAAEACWRCNECRAWLKLGYDTKGEWLAQPEVSMKRSTFDQMVRAWGGTVEQRKIPLEQLREIDVSKVDIVLPKVTGSKVSIKAALSDAKVLGWHDLREKYSGIPSPADPPPAAEEDPDDGDEDGEGPTSAEAVAAMDDAQKDADEAYASGAAYARLHHDTLGWLLFDLRTRPARRLDLIEQELTDGQHE